MTGTILLCIIAANIALLPAARALARWMIERELRRALREDLDRWGDPQRR